MAFENDLYTFRVPDMTSVKPDSTQLMHAVFDAKNKDAEVENIKADVEERGLAALRVIEAWPSGAREVSEDDRAPLLAYVGLLIAQHPTMMNARARLIRERLWAEVEPRFGRPAPLERVLDEMSKGIGALAVVSDGFATALELNYLAWKVVRWPDSHGVILGDVGVAAWFAGDAALGSGDVWAQGAEFFLPISPSSVLILGGVLPGVCVVESREGAGSDAEVTVVNVVSWARSRASVFATDRSYLEQTRAALGPIPPGADFSLQLGVRESVLPSFKIDRRGEFLMTQPPEPSPEEVRRRWDSWFEQ